MKKTLKSGSGYIEPRFCEDGIFEIDFDARDSDDSADVSYVNHESVLFWAADSYKTCCLLLMENLEVFDSQVSKENDCWKAHSKYYLPCMFNFRHSIEIYLKTFYLILSKTAWKGTHNLLDLICEVKNEISRISELEEYYEKKGYSFQEKKSD